MKSKIKKLKQAVSLCDYEVFSTWMKNKVIDAAIIIKGYRLFRSAWSHLINEKSSGEGVMIFVKNSY